MYKFETLQSGKVISTEILRNLEGRLVYDAQRDTVAAALANGETTVTVPAGTIFEYRISAENGTVWNEWFTSRGVFVDFVIDGELHEVFFPAGSIPHGCHLA